MKEVKLGKYKHFKGEIYEVIAVAKHSETLEELVIYKNDKGETWARPKEMFLDQIKKEKYKGPRFEYIGD